MAKKTSTTSTVSEDAISKASKATDTAINNPTDAITKTKVASTDVNKNQMVSSDSGQVDQTHTAKTSTIGNTATADKVKATDANTYNATTVSNKVDKVANNLKAAQGTVSKNAIAKAATAKPSDNATVQGQLENLMSQFEDGEVPAWAAGAYRMATTTMAQRGLGSSSMAASATTQALMESALSIAVADASTYSQFELTNLNNRQQAALQNAQAFLTMDLQNLSNRQEVNLYKTQAKIQGLFTDQAATNAAKQFNATSENQTDQFFAQLKSQVSQFNAAQKNATAQFNADQKNAVSMFNTQMKNQTEQFNANNRLIIDQSNAEWRRQIATQDNANENEANRIDAQAATGLTTSAYNNLWQTERDLMSYAFTSAENAADRVNQLALSKISASSVKDAAKAQQSNALGQAVGAVAGKIFDSVIGSIF